MMKKFSRWLRVVLALFLVILFVARSAPNLAEQRERVRAYSRPFEFEYLSWMTRAMGNKFGQFSLGAERYVPSTDGSQFLIEYLEVVNEVFELERDLQDIYSDPSITDPEREAKTVEADLAEKRAQRQNLTPLAEEVLQGQINAALAELGITVGGQAIPPVLYQAVHKSYALIISPRDEIRTDINLMLIPNLTLEEITGLENDLESNLDVSALVVRVGGVGTYPAMIVEGGGLPWLVHVVSHEWVHNYLTIRPLGMRYYANPSMTAINETVADLASYEVRDAVLERFYPAYASTSPAPQEEKSFTETEKFMRAFWEMRQDHLFDFRHEMHKTRVVVDHMLADGQVEEAEAYMEERRAFFWEHGYRIRKLNQAYFAFHGSYAARPGGAVSGSTNTLGNNIRGLRDEMPSLAAFMRKVAWIWRAEQFDRAFEE
ncbi:MAG: hypothetical protein MAG431_00545 [Chloroflexi bacterium]|nr:hypothetical protein [Chloroflexota bacterium]